MIFKNVMYLFHGERLPFWGGFGLASNSEIEYSLASRTTKGLAMPTPQENLQNIRRQIDDAKREYDALNMAPRESLRDFEYRVKQHSDKLLSLKIAEKVQLQLLEQEARDAEEQLKTKNF